MSRRLVVFLGGAIMLAMAVMVARMFREPVSSLPGEEVAQVGNSVSGSLQDAPQASLPSPLPSPDAMRMSSGDSAALPVTQVEARPALPAGVAPVVEDSASGSGQVTEAPAPAAAPADAVELPATPQGVAPSANREARPGSVAEPGGSPSAGKSPASPALAPAASPAPEAAAPVPGTPARQAATASAPDAAQSTDKAEASVSVGSAAKTAAASSVSSSSSSSPSSSPASGASDKTLKPGTLVTKSSLPAKAGARVVTAAVLTMDGDVVTLNLQGSGAMQGKAFMLTGPDRVVLDIEGEWKVEIPRVPSNRMVKALRTGRQGTATRLVFDMKVKPARVNVAKPGADSLELTIR